MIVYECPEPVPPSLRRTGGRITSDQLLLNVCLNQLLIVTCQLFYSLAIKSSYNNCQMVTIYIAIIDQELVNVDHQPANVTTSS